MTRAQEREASVIFGKHVSSEKALFTFLFSMLACAVPMLLGLRLWVQIPPIVETGFIRASGEDDSLPRAVLVYGIPGLMCVLNLICHAQLWLHQKSEKLPPLPVRLLGRWTIPVLSVLLSCFWILKGADEAVSLAFYIPCVLALLLMLLGSHFFDCTRENHFAFHLKHIEYKEAAWRKTHRFAGLTWALAGLLLLLLYLWLGRLPWYSAVFTVFLLLLPVPLSFSFAKDA